MNLVEPKWLTVQIGKYSGSELQAYQNYAEWLKTVLTRACRTLAPGADVTARAKEVRSFAEKAARKRPKYSDPARQLTDLCGSRGVTHTHAVRPGDRGRQRGPGAGPPQLNGESIECDWVTPADLGRYPMAFRNDEALARYKSTCPLSAFHTPCPEWNLT